MINMGKDDLIIKKRIRRRIIFFAAVFILSALCSPGIMLRAAVFIHSPKSAITMQYEAIDVRTHNGQLYKITENVPVEKSTKGMLTTWIVYRLGPFHVASYYGEG